MKAVICKYYGDPEGLEYTDVETPVPKDNEVLIKIINASVSSGDAKIRSLNLQPLLAFVMQVIFGFKKPRNGILGSQFSGIIEETGSKVTKFKKGDEVYGITGMKLACYAQYICLKEKAVIIEKPHSMSFEEVVPVSFGAMSALHILRKGNIQKDQDILIYGASGSVGTYGVQLAKYLGARVTAVCSESNFQLVKSIGADKVIDYHKEDFAQSPLKYDVVFDAVGKISSKKGKQALKPGGKFISIKTPTSESLEKLEYLNKIIQEEKLITVIDKKFMLSEIQEAHRYVDKGHKKGNIVIEVEHE